MKISLKKIFESNSIIDQNPDPKSSRKWMGSMSDKIVVVNSTESGNLINITIRDVDGNLSEVGILEMKRVAAHYGKCLSGFRVSFSDADKGWGPIMYETALEIATHLSTGLMPDRASVSADAERVWDKFMTRKNYRVKIVQLDDINADRDEKLTPNDLTDDCIMPDSGDSPAVRSLKNLHDRKKARKNKFNFNNQTDYEEQFRDDKFSPLSDKEDEREEYLINPLTKLYQSNGAPTIDSLVRNKKIYFEPSAQFLIKKLKIEPKYNIVLKENKKYKLSNFLLLESRGVHDLDRIGAMVYIIDKPHENGVEIAIKKEFINKENKKNIRTLAHIMMQNPTPGICNNSYIVKLSFIYDESLWGQGWGQFLYSLALEYAASKGVGISPDRGEISLKAQKVWQNFQNTKKSTLGQSIKTQQLDDAATEKEKRLTPNISEDDCDNDIQLFDTKKLNLIDDREGFIKSPFTKTYKVDSTPNLKILHDAGLIVIK